MKKFDIITEADARVLPRGESVVLTRGGHVTPLAADTLKERRVRIVREGLTSADEAALAPKADIRSVAIASDHTGGKLRRSLVEFLRGRGIAVEDLGVDDGEFQPRERAGRGGEEVLIPRGQRGGQRFGIADVAVGGMLDHHFA